MDRVHNAGRLDWLVELSGASAPGIAAAFAALKLAPLQGYAAAPAMLAGGIGTFVLAFAAMRLVPATAPAFSLPPFGSILIEDELLLDQPMDDDDVLLLDQPVLDDRVAAVAELLLDDPLPAAAPDSRVVQLFADGRMPSAGEFKSRIDRHLAGGGAPALAADASDALSEALAELRRSLRRA